MNLKVKVKFLFLPFFLMGAKSVEESKPSRIVVYTSSYDVKPYDQKASANSIFTFSHAVFGQPIYISQDYNLTPGLLRDWKWDYSRNRYVLKVDTSKKFHTGRSISAQDFEFMIIKSFLSSVKLLEKKWLLNVKGIGDLKQGQKYKSGMVEGIKVVDQETLEIIPENYDPSLLYTLAKSIPSLTPIEEMADDLVNFKNSPVGAGDYKVIWSDPNSSTVRLAKVDKNRKGPDEVDLVSGGELAKLKPDIVMGGIGIRGTPLEKEFRVLSTEVPTSVSVIDFNYKTPSGSNPLFRKMVATALDRDFINKDRPTSKSTNEILPEIFWGRINAESKYNLEKAIGYFKALPKDQQEMTHTILFHGPVGKVPDYIKRTKECFDKIGLKTNFVQTSIVGLGDTESKVSMMVYGSVAEFQDPLNHFSAYNNNSSRPYQHPERDPEFQKLYDAAFRSANQSEKVNAIKKLSQYFYDKDIAVPIAENRIPVFVTSRILSIGKQYLGSALDLEQIQIDKGL